MPSLEPGTQRLYQGLLSKDAQIGFCLKDPRFIRLSQLVSTVSFKSGFIKHSVQGGRKEVKTQINTTEETFQSDIIDSTIFQTNSFDFLSEFA